MKRLMLLSMVVLAVAVPVLAEDAAEVPAVEVQKADRERLGAELRGVEMQIREATEKLRKEDPEIQAAAEAAKAAVSKEKELVDAKLKANPETAALLAKREDLMGSFRKLQPKREGGERKAPEGAAKPPRERKEKAGAGVAQ